MKNLKRFFAILGIIVLVGMYVISLVFALIDSPWAMDCLRVSLGLTLILPILLWIYIAMFRYMAEKKEENTKGSQN